MFVFVFVFVLLAKAILYELIPHIPPPSATPEVTKHQIRRKTSSQEAIVSKVRSGPESGCNKWNAKRAKFEQSSIGLGEGGGRGR